MRPSEKFEAKAASEKFEAKAAGQKGSEAWFSPR
jgi:hypothetical protein